MLLIFLCSSNQVISFLLTFFTYLYLGISLEFIWFIKVVFFAKAVSFLRGTWGQLCEDKHHDLLFLILQHQVPLGHLLSLFETPFFLRKYSYWSFGDVVRSNLQVTNKQAQSHTIVAAFGNF
jgi:hypothetical protein